MGAAATISTGITEQQLEAFNRNGFVLIDTLLTAGELDAAEAGWDAVVAGGSAYEVREYVNTLAHPFFENVAKRESCVRALQR